MDTLNSILAHKIVAIIRGARPEDFMKITRALADGGLRLMEVTLNSPSALSLISQACAEMGSSMLIGAGTVLDAISAKAAIAAGARFIISPTLDKETIHTTKQLGAVSIPGAFTATEILAAYTYGADIVKVFPASVGPHYFKDLRGPLPHIPLMPTGGVSLSNIRAYQDAGAVAFGVGSSLIDTSREMTAGYLQELTDKARQFAEAVK